MIIVKAKTVIIKSIALALILGLITTLACNTQEVDGFWNGQEMNIDGLRTEWNDIPFTYFDDQDVVLGMCNDSNNLYIIFSFRNQQWARMIATRGLTLWFDADGKQSKDIGLHYIDGPPPEELFGDSDFDGRPDGRRFRDQDDSSQTRNRLAIINKKNNRTDISTNGLNGPAVGFATKNDIHTYEFSIPLTESGFGNYGIDTEIGQIIGIGAEWGGMDRERMKKMRGDGPSGGGPGGGMRSGGGGRGGMGGGGRGGMQPPEPQEIWVKTILVPRQVAGNNDVSETIE